jgi:hypothetical protein
MPSTVRLSTGSLLTTVRRLETSPRRHSWIEAWKSADDGVTWSKVGNSVADTGEGNPPHLIKLTDGRLCLTYGVRAAPFSICARLSKDGGITWSEAIVLRRDAGGRDIGYPRSVERPDGKVVTIYYFWDRQSGPERYIEACMWTPPAVP